MNLKLKKNHSGTITSVQQFKKIYYHGFSVKEIKCSVINNPRKPEVVYAEYLEVVKKNSGVQVDIEDNIYDLGSLDVKYPDGSICWEFILPDKFAPHFYFKISYQFFNQDTPVSSVIHAPIRFGEYPTPSADGRYGGIFDEVIGNVPPDADNIRVSFIDLEGSLLLRVRLWRIGSRDEFYTNDPADIECNAPLPPPDPHTGKTPLLVYRVPYYVDESKVKN